MEEKILDLSSLGRTKIIIKNGVDDKELYLNLTDMNIISRVKETQEKLTELSDKVAKVKVAGDDTESVFALSDTLKEADAEMRKALDYIFDAPVSDVCIGNSSCFDIINGKCRFEQVLDAIMNLYSETIGEEAKHLQKMQKHTSKYVH